MIYAENRSFDNLYGLFPGANGQANATPDQYIQVDHDGKPLPHLPPVWKGSAPDPAFPTNLPNRPFRIDAPPVNLPLSVATRDLVHRYYQNLEQIDGGKLDRYVEASDAGALTMGYYDGSQLPMWKWAQEYTLADNYFTGAFGGSYLNHFWLICACTPEHRDAPPSMRAQLDGQLLKRKQESPPSAIDRTSDIHARRRSDTGRMVGQYHAAGVSAVAHPAREGWRPAVCGSVEKSFAAANAEKHRRHAFSEGDLVGLVFRRLGSGAERRHAGSRGAAQGDQHQCERRARTS